jgi:hypothetical protein
LNRYLIASEISPPNFHTIRDGTPVEAMSWSHRSQQA